MQAEQFCLYTEKTLTHCLIDIVVWVLPKNDDLDFIEGTRVKSPACSKLCSIQRVYTPVVIIFGHSIPEDQWRWRENLLRSPLILDELFKLVEIGLLELIRQIGLPAIVIHKLRQVWR